MENSDNKSSDVDIDSISSEYKKILEKDYIYPSPKDKDFQYKIYKKREHIGYRFPERAEYKDDKDIKQHRDRICTGQVGLLAQQSFLANFVNPNTPNRGVLIFHGVGTGKTCAGVAIGEQFKPLVQKYGTKIHVLVSGPLIKEVWKEHLLKCTGETYLKQQDLNIFLNEAERQKAQKNAVNIALQYYKFMSYRSFYKKVLGEKILDKEKTADNKTKNVYRKTEEGEYERDISADRIHSLNNTIIIVDEAHNLTGNAYGEALLKIINNSHNLKIILLTATPMKNLADDIIELINFIRPQDSPIQRDRVFNSYKNHMMDFKTGGIEYFKKMSNGYVSYLRGVDPLTFATKVEKGKIPNGLLFTKITQCKMLEFQKNVYDETVRISEEDTLDRKSEAVANFSFPGLSQDRKSIQGYYGREGINTIKNQLKINQELLNKKIALEVLKEPNLENESDLLYMADDGRSLTGKILKFKYLKNFSVKFYKALKKISRLFYGKKGARTAFVYSNLVKVGIDLFREILFQNGYLEYDEDQTNYKIKSNTVCYFCGYKYSEHKDGNIVQSKEKDENRSDSSTEYDIKKDIPSHKFDPATFISITGKSSEESADVIPEEKQAIIKNVFNSVENIEGKKIKFVLGSKVMGEGITLKNVAEIHILDVYFNLGKIDQVIGRAIRYCSHYSLMGKDNMYPTVNVYKYAVTLKDGLSSEEELYQKAERKYLLIKQVERALKEISIDCPLNKNANVFIEEIEKYKKCVPPGVENKNGQETCVALCDYMECDYKCDSSKLNEKYYNPDKKNYRALKKNELDYSTFTQDLAKSEIDAIKNKIKEMYRVKYVYTLKDIINYVKNMYEGDQKELFDEYFVFKALDELIPISENDFNNFKDTIIDKFNRIGYLIHINKFYIFQPFDQNEDVPMYYRSIFDRPMEQQLTLYNYLKNARKDIKKVIKTKKEDKKLDDKLVYSFENIMDYYENRDEFKFVGIIDKESSRRKVKENLQDVFKIREKRSKILDKKRGTGIPSLKGAVCETSKSVEYLENIAKNINIKISGEETRKDICDQIRDKLLQLEKYSTGKQKMTYIMIPENHPIYPFPYNLEDRTSYIIDKIKERIKFKLNISKKEIKVKRDKEEFTNYKIEIQKDSKLDEFLDFLKNMGAKIEGNKLVIYVE